MLCRIFPLNLSGKGLSMKICPKCNQTYSDASLNFCLNDGSPLSAANESQPTVLVTPPRPTAGNQQFGAPSQAPQWNIPNQPAQAPRPKSKAWIWVLGIVGAVVLLCGGGFAALIALVPDTLEADNSNYSNKTVNSGNASNNTSKTPSTVLKDDLSSWKPSNQALGETNYSDGEFTMSSNLEGYYYVLVTPKTNFKTDNATAKVTVRNKTSDTTTYGFGVLVHSDQKEPLKKGYAFLIDSQSMRYRIAQHTDKDEKTVVDWKRSTVIKDGAEENVLEVRDEKGKMSFYINGEFVDDYTDKDGVTSGVVGLYVSDAVPIAFSDLEIRK